MSDEEERQEDRDELIRRLRERLDAARRARDLSGGGAFDLENIPPYESAVERGQLRPSLGALERLAERLRRARGEQEGDQEPPIEPPQSPPRPPRRPGGPRDDESGSGGTRRERIPLRPAPSGKSAGAAEKPPTS